MKFFVGFFRFGLIYVCLQIGIGAAIWTLECWPTRVNERSYTFVMPDMGARCDEKSLTGLWIVSNDAMANDGQAYRNRV